MSDVKKDRSHLKKTHFNRLLGISLVLGIAVVSAALFFVYSTNLFGVSKDLEFQESFKDVGVYFADEKGQLLNTYSMQLQQFVRGQGLEVSSSTYLRDVLSQEKVWQRIWAEPEQMKQKGFYTHIRQLALAQVTRSEMGERDQAGSTLFSWQMQISLKLYLSETGKIIDAYTFSVTQVSFTQAEAREAAYAAALIELRKRFAGISTAR